MNLMVKTKRKIKTFVSLGLLGSVCGWTFSFLIGATAVGVLGVGIGGAAGFIFSISGIIIAFAIYGIYRLSKD